LLNMSIHVKLHRQALRCDFQVTTVRIVGEAR
jgi:hypothetical protein